MLSVESGSAWKIEHVDQACFYSSGQVEKLIHDTETTVTDILFCGDRQQAKKLLKVSNGKIDQGFWLAFRIGMLAGCFVVLSILVVISGNKNSSYIHLNSHI